jgi:hypothetical protein
MRYETAPLVQLDSYSLGGQTTHAALKPAEGDSHKGDAVAVLRVDISLACTLNTKPATSGSSGEIGRGSAGCGRRRSNSPTPRNNSRTQRAAEIDRGQTALAIGPLVEWRGRAPSPSQPPRAIWRELLSATAAAVSGRRRHRSGPAR